MPVTTIKKKLLSWTRLVRLPNLFTLPGDIMVGYFFTGQDNPALLGCLVLVSLCLYSAGIIQNDLCDLGEDRSYRLARPLVTGAITPRQAKIALAILLCTAIFFSASGGRYSILCAALLLGMILFYNSKARRWKYVGFAVMGLLRAGNMLLGASAMIHMLSPGLVAVACCEAAYVFVICVLAHNERTASKQTAAVTLLIRGLMPLQCLFLIAGGCPIAALAVACLIPCNMLLVRKGYYAT
ncbi:UbiA family prenyltransferase [Thermodesulfobacteriota bacterium]